MPTLNRRTILGAALLAGGASSTGRGLAQEAPRWPTRPIRLIIAFAPGGFTDIAGRVLAASLSRALGQPVVVENRPGAAGLIGTEAAAQASPDGYTLLLGTISTHAINVGLYNQLPYDPIRSFVPVSGVASGQLVLVVHPSVQARTVPELIALARARPGELTYGSGGTGTTSHLAGELFKSMAGVNLLHVPSRSPAPASSALLGGQVDAMFDTVASALPQIRSGGLRALGISSIEPAPELPDVPPVAQALPGFETGTWVGLFAPAGTPAAVVARIDAATRDVLAAGETRSRLAELGMQPLVADSRSFSDYQRGEIAKWVGVIRRAGITPD
ncbi:Bug family tripartite tricarboxylate transporter substrate binding protein [Roseomonas populi]|uniref:Tripartite tricarboxylate transporter substrate binding protein n=1 Tax=Roseomonas populi TaxID=3121582 RepID=A0ABT1XBD7_9PROT|nr:tripartite tricarboxylate transporter substrate binding protein [Roseomonas pecuniae]MCR0985436.1 tripartite tricarboxylate transporter substrate binding protein [Roseomonas pecuniae]